MVVVSTDLIAAAFTITSSCAFTRAPLLTLAAVWLFTLPTSTAPPMPPRPPAIARTKVLASTLLLATTTASCALSEFPLAFQLISASLTVA